MIIADMKVQSVKRTDDVTRASEFHPPASRAYVLFSTGFPALKCWATFDRPLRGLITLLRYAGLSVTAHLLPCPIPRSHSLPYASSRTFIAVPDLLLRGFLPAFDASARRQFFRISGGGFLHHAAFVFSDLGKRTFCQD